MQRRLIVLITALLLAVFFGGSAVASTQTEPPLSKNMVAFGDSMAYGYSDLTLEGVKGYNKRYAESVEAVAGTPVTLENYSMRSHTMGMIYDTMSEHVSDISEADIITLDGGGNDWREARIEYLRGECDDICFSSVVERAKTDYTNAMELIAANRKPDSQVIVMSYFYPYVYEDVRENRSYRTLASFHSDYTRHAEAEADRVGFAYVNLIPTFNNSYENPVDPRSRRLTRQGDALHPTTKGHIAIKDLMVAASNSSAS